MWYIQQSDELYHHGILGQKWGKMNGPPYPLGSSDHSASERKAGWRKSLDGGSNEKKKHRNREGGMSDKQKKALKIGAGVVATAAVVGGTYYLYKTGKLDKAIEMGKNTLNGLDLNGKVNDLKPNNIDAGKKFVDGAMKFDIPDFNFSPPPNATPKPNAPKFAPNGLKLQSARESLSESLKNTNPGVGTDAMKNNCTNCAVTGFLRTIGYDVTAKGTGGKQQILGGVIENCFKDAKVIDGSATKFGKSVEDASEMLVKRFGNNASGVCAIQWKKGGGHAFNWKITNGKVEFLDFQMNRTHDVVKKYWSLIDANNSLTLARLDNLEVNGDELLKYMSNR